MNADRRADQTVRIALRVRTAVRAGQTTLRGTVITSVSIPKLSGESKDGGN